MRSVTVLGSGSMGTVMGMILADRVDDVRLWSRSQNRAIRLQQDGENRRDLPAHRFPNNLQVQSDPDSSLRSTDLIVLAIPSAYLRVTLDQISDHVDAETPVLSVVKGLARLQMARPSEIVGEILGKRPIAVLSGPSHAEELAMGLPASLVLACADRQLADQLCPLLNSDRLRIYQSPDVLGVELCGALKNVFGLAAGICQGLDLGDNALAALLTRGRVEMVRFVTAMGGVPETLDGLAGLGDLLTTCYSDHGRNRALGEAIGRGLSLEDAKDQGRGVAEGVTTVNSVYRTALESSIEMPIVEQLYKILYEGKHPQDALADLMSRKPGHEVLPGSHLAPSTPAGSRL